MDGDDVVRLDLRDEGRRSKAIRLLEGGGAETLKVLLDEARDAAPAS